MIHVERDRSRLEEIEIEVADIGSAELIRNKFPDCLHHADDKRKKTVCVVEDTPWYCMDEIIRIETLSYEQREESYGQVPLNARERAKIDFTRTNVFHARSCKAIANAKGVLGWLDYYDHSLTVGEHVDIFSFESGEPDTMRMMATEIW